MSSCNLQELETQIVEVKDEIRQLEREISLTPTILDKRHMLEDKLALKRVDLAKLERKHKRSRGC